VKVKAVAPRNASHVNPAQNLNCLWRDVGFVKVVFNRIINANDMFEDAEPWKNSAGYYCALARGALTGALRLQPKDINLSAALTWLLNTNAPYTSQASFRNDPTFDLAPVSVAGLGRAFFNKIQSNIYRVSLKLIMPFAATQPER